MERGKIWSSFGRLPFFVLRVHLMGLTNFNEFSGINPKIYLMKVKLEMFE